MVFNRWSMYLVQYKCYVARCTWLEKQMNNLIIWLISSKSGIILTYVKIYVLHKRPVNFRDTNFLFIAVWSPVWKCSCTYFVPLIHIQTVCRRYFTAKNSIIYVCFSSSAIVERQAYSCWPDWTEAIQLSILTDESIGPLEPHYPHPYSANLHEANIQNGGKAVHVVFKYLFRNLLVDRGWGGWGNADLGCYI